MAVCAGLRTDRRRRPAQGGLDQLARHHVVDGVLTDSTQTSCSTSRCRIGKLLSFAPRPRPRDAWPMAKMTARLSAASDRRPLELRVFGGAWQLLIKDGTRSSSVGSRQWQQRAGHLAVQCHGHLKAAVVEGDCLMTEAGGQLQVGLGQALGQQPARAQFTALFLVMGEDQIDAPLQRQALCLAERFERPHRAGVTGQIAFANADARPSRLPSTCSPPSDRQSRRTQDGFLATPAACMKRTSWA